MDYAADTDADKYASYLYTLLVSGSKEDDGGSWVEEARQKLDEMEKEKPLEIAAVLYHILDHGKVVQKLPPELLDNILSRDPKAILMPYDDDGDSFLSHFIKNKSLDQAKKAELVGKILEVMIRQEETLRSLGESLGENLPDYYDRVEIEGPGTKCIQAAFNFNFGQAQRQGPLPIPVDLLKRLVNLATSNMLQGKKEDNNPTPLQQIADYQMSLHDHKGQLDLARLLLDKCEEAIWDRVAKGTKLQLPKNQERLPTEASVYEWHEYTRTQWHKHIGAGIQHNDASASVNVSDKGSLQTSELPARASDPVRLQIKDTADKAKTKVEDTRNPRLDQKKIRRSDTKNDMEDKEPINSVKNNSSGKEGKVDMPVVKDGQSPGPGTPNGMGKELYRGRRQRPSVTDKRINSSINITAGVTQDQIKQANVASEELLKELGLRFLRSTLNSDLEYRRVPFVSGAEADFDGVVTDEDVLDAFFGNQKRQYYFTLDTGKKDGYGTMTKQTVDSFFQRYNYNAVLRHVTLCRVNIEFPQERGRPEYKGDQLYFLHWLRGRGVEKILKVTVDDMEKPHRDEEIEEVLSGRVYKPPVRKNNVVIQDWRPGPPVKSFNVEILDWRKPDLCPQMIQTAAPGVRELHLRWSGNNVVLRGWSEPEGLPRLEWLKRVWVYYDATRATKRRLDMNIDLFKKRVRDSRSWCLKNMRAREGPQDVKGPYGPWQAIDVYPVENWVQDGSAQSEAQAFGAEEVEQPWFKNVRDLVDLVPDLPSPPDKLAVPTPPHLTKVKVALIDDGVDVLDSVHMNQSHFLPGRSFDTAQDGPHPEYSSVNGHGNYMARSILRICPKALIIPYRLKTLAGASSFKPQPEPGSAAKAIKQAIDDGVDVISMSWTIHLDNAGSSRLGLNELKRVVLKAKEAKKRIPLMFCAMRDDGEPGANKEDLPAGMQECKTFRIGAAEASGSVYSRLSYSDAHRQTTYLFPGVDIQDVLYSDAANVVGEANPDMGDLQLSAKAPEGLTVMNGVTGSSIATALAAGLAALLLHCTKLGVYYTQQVRGNPHPIQPEAVAKNGEFAQMSSAFDKLCSINKQNLKYANPADRFQSAIQQLKRFDDDGGVHTDRPETLQPIAALCRTLFD